MKTLKCITFRGNQVLYAGHIVSPTASSNGLQCDPASHVRAVFHCHPLHKISYSTLYASMLLVFLRPGASTWCPDQVDVRWFQNIQDIEGLRGEHVVSIPQSLSREFPLGFRPVFVNTASFAWLPPSLRVSASAGASLPSPATEPPQSDPFFRGASGSLRIRTQSSAGRPGVSKLGRSGTNSRRSDIWLLEQTAKVKFLNTSFSCYPTVHSPL
jgi:hypothetical protein